MKRLLIVASVLGLAACNMPDELPNTVAEMEVVSRDDTSRRFDILLRDVRTGAEFNVRPGFGKRRKCPNGPQVRIGQRLRVVVNNYRYGDGRTTYEVDRHALRSQIC